MISGWLLILISILYISLLFAIGWAGDRRPGLYRRTFLRKQVYGLSLAVYFTSWTFYGAVGRSTTEGLGFLPIYLGPLLVFLLFAPVLRRIIFISKRSNTTSIADFIASRYGKSQLLAALIAIVAVVGSIPYIALQLKAIAMGFTVLTAGPEQIGIERQPIWGDTAWYIAIVLTLFTILFGTRHLESTEHHRGMIQAVAFESVIKLVAFVSVGLFVGYSLFDGFGDLYNRLEQHVGVVEFAFGPLDPFPFVVQTLVAMFAIVCLPRQFHVMVVENTDHRDFETARWMMALYLVVATAFVLPIAGAGLIIYGDAGGNADMMVLNLPLGAGQEWLAVLAFLGGGSAAAAMVIVSTVALATMVSNEVVMPGLLRFFHPDMHRRRDLSFLLLTIRRITIGAIVVIAYSFYRLTGEAYSLTAFGLLSFAAVAQFGPALIGGVLWRRGNQQGAIWGLCAGFGFWCYTLLFPTLANTGLFDATWLEQGLWGMQWSRPTAFLGLNLDPTTHGIVWSLGINAMLYVLVSLFTRQRVREKIQIATYFHDSQPRFDSDDQHVWESQTLVSDLRALADRFMGEARAEAIFNRYQRRNAIKLLAHKPATPHLMKYTERQLASVIGASTARVVLESTLTGRDMQIEDVVSIVDEASQAMTFSRELLQSAIENISLGVSVVDPNQRLVAWNQRYLQFFSYPRRFVKVGRPVGDLIRYNLIMANLPARNVEEMVEERVHKMRTGIPHSSERQRADGTVILMEGNPLPGGGYVTTFQDISAARRTEQALKETNTYLEQRVKERTEELQELNGELLKAKSVAEKANQSKTRFLAAASHDLLQPLNAARLFTSALVGQPQAESSKELVEHIDRSLEAAEEIISTLLDISKLDAGALEPRITDFCINDLLQHLVTEFSAIALDQGLSLDTVPSSAWVRSDSQLLRRVVQNLLSNAIRYTTQGRILLGCRRLPGHLRIEVWDTGPGIPQDKLVQIFEEFRRLQQGRDQHGLGLGLAIVERISQMLNHPVEVHSRQGKGSVFSITVPLGKVGIATRTPMPLSAQRSVGGLHGLSVLCVDNEDTILEGMVALLSNWGCSAIAARSLSEARERLAGTVPDIVLGDYQLDDDANGLDTMDSLRTDWNTAVPGILITGFVSDEVRLDARHRGYQVLYKPVKPAALRALINKEIRRRN
ncbi:MAG: histidine kinase [Alteromonadaceae bacterium]|nr:histidine kinase [Alteromonadaceae bacterium]